MSDFFTRLAEKAVGEAPSIKPVVLPRFARPDFSDEKFNGDDSELNRVNDNDSSASQATRHVNQLTKSVLPEKQKQRTPLSSTVSHKGSNVPPGKKWPKQLSRDASSKSGITQTQPVINKDLEVAHADEQQQKPLIKNVNQAGKATHKSIYLSDETVHLPQNKKNNSATENVNEQPLLMPQQSEGIHSENNHASKLTRALEKHETPAENIANKAPVIEVKIGRIEIRAENPKQTRVKAPLQKNRSSNRLSLDDYLAKRNQELQ